MAEENYHTVAKTSAATQESHQSHNDLIREEERSGIVIQPNIESVRRLRAGSAAQSSWE